MGQNRTGQGGSEQNWPGWVRTDLVRVGKNTTGQGGSEHNWSGWGQYGTGKGGVRAEQVKCTKARSI